MTKPSERALKKANQIVYGIQWTEDKTLIERIALALDAEAAPKKRVLLENQAVLILVESVRNLLISGALEQYVKEYSRPQPNASGIIDTVHNEELKRRATMAFYTLKRSLESVESVLAHGKEV
jgi:hypothetical protein